MSNLTLINSGSAATASSEVPMVTVGGVSVPLTDAIMLTASHGGASTYDCLKRNGVNYQVPAGYKLVLVGAKYITINAGANSVTLGTATAAVTGGAVAPAGWAVKSWGNAVNQPFTKQIIGESVEYSFHYEFLASSYPHAFSNSGGGHGMYVGYLVAV